MEFSFKDVNTSKCDSCVHAFRAKSYNSPTTVTICRVLNVGVGKIEKCNYHQTLSQSGPPAHMLLDAWMIDVNKNRSGRVMGFRASPPPTPEELKAEALKDANEP